MKQYLILLLAIVLVFCAGCGNQAPAATETTSAPNTEPLQTAPPETTLPPETTEPPVVVPALTTGIAKAHKTPAVLSLLNRGDEVGVVGEYDEEHYVIKTNLGYGLVKRNLLRMEGEEAYTVWTGYAYQSAEVYSGMELMGEPILVLNLNTQIEVLEDLGHCYLVRTGETEGFMVPGGVSKWAISYGGGGGGGGADGGDISLSSAITQSGEVTGKATVLASGTPVILGYFDLNAEIPLVAEEGFAENWEGYLTVYLDGLYAYVPRMLVQTADEEAFQPRDGFSRWNGVVYDNYQCLGEPVEKLYTNVQVRVIGELDNCYIVEVNGIVGYMPKDLVSDTRIASSGGGGGGGGGGEWSPPVL